MLIQPIQPAGPTAHQPARPWPQSPDGMAQTCHSGQKGQSPEDWVGAGLAGAEEVPLPARTPESEPLLTPSEVAKMFRVDPKTVTRWAKAGKLTSIRTLGGHRRYREREVRALLAGEPYPLAVDPGDEG